MYRFNGIFICEVIVVVVEMGKAQILKALNNIEHENG
jgi:hypothetical protein